MNDNLSAAIESILFVKSEPVKIRELGALLGIGKREVEEALEVLERALEGRGICLMRKEDEVFLGTSPEFSEYLKRLAEEEFNSPLSQSALEVLAVIAYRGPVTRSEIDYIRGVNSSFVLRNLLMRGLVERIPNPRDSRSYLYKPSINLLRWLGVKKIEDLPQYGEFNEKIENFVSDEAPAGAGEGSNVEHKADYSDSGN